jgi:GH15 family glucan-1,4-alpha-glucosidase
MQDECHTAFQPLRYSNGYLPIEHHGLIGDCTTAALVARDGAVDWLCVPRFDSDALFCGLLDFAKGGAFRITPEDALEARQRYLQDTAVLETEIRSRTGLVRLTDACAVRAGADLGEDVSHARGELVRLVEVLDGHVRLQVELAPRGGASARPVGGGLHVQCNLFPDHALQLTCSRELNDLRSSFGLRAGDRLWFTLRWGEAAHQAHATDPSEALENTIDAWRRWSEKLDYDGPQKELVQRSAFTLKLLDYSPNGAIIAAPTSSLPEKIGGERNWDYRYTWVRDAAFSVYALRRIGLHKEGDSFLSWVLGIVELGGYPNVLYDLDGSRPPPERIDADLKGYCGSAPVRWGNAAAAQRQHDAYGEILDCAYQSTRGRAAPERQLWERLRGFIELALRDWDSPDRGIWEVRTADRPFTYSAALCQVAADRGARLAERYSLPGDAPRWKAAAEQIREAILERAWDPRKNSLTEHLGPGGIDASLLSLPLRRVIAADHPKMISTTAAIERRLGAGGGLLYRYLPEESPDGIAGSEGAFLLCSFWLVDNYAKQGRLQDAMDLYDALCARAGPLGLLPEQIDPSSGCFLGNYPQAFSHVGVISSGINLSWTMEASAGHRGSLDRSRQSD